MLRLAGLQDALREQEAAVGAGVAGKGGGLEAVQHRREKVRLRTGDNTYQYPCSGGSWLWQGYWPA